jgi:hypothetical protein
VLSSSQRESGRMVMCVPEMGLGKYWLRKGKRLIFAAAAHFRRCHHRFNRVYLARASRISMREAATHFQN